jgi:tripartite-type tricarboxylate transporter receptor subunit TctC
MVDRFRAGIPRAQQTFEIMKHTLAALVAATALSAIAPAIAQSFPVKPITIVVPASPGGAIDLAARLVGQKLTESMGQPVLIDNKTGATGIIGTDFVAKAAPDGYTLALVASSHAINPSMKKVMPFDAIKSFEPVVLTHVVPLMLVVSPSLPVKTVRELIAYGKANPGKLTLHPAVPVALLISRESFSRRWLALTWFMCLTRAALWHIQIC